MIPTVEAQKVDFSMYSDFIHYAETIDCGKVYPLSIAEEIQDGEIFANSINDHSAVLFWHHSGFAFLAGKPDETFLEKIYELILNKNNTNPRRFILLVKDEKIEKFFQLKENIILEKRYLFEYPKKERSVDFNLPAGYELREINTSLLSGIHGNIVPSLFWKDIDKFFERGKGYCIVHDNHIAAWAFSAAISSKEIDIGIETDKDYRNRGLAAIVANRMIQYAVEEGKAPVWACHYQNIASKRTAEKIGFVKTAECSIIKRKEYSCNRSGYDRQAALY